MNPQDLITEAIRLYTKETGRRPELLFGAYRKEDGSDDTFIFEIHLNDEGRDMSVEVRVPFEDLPLEEQKHWRKK